MGIQVFRAIVAFPDSHIYLKCIKQTIIILTLNTIILSPVGVSKFKLLECSVSDLGLMFAQPCLSEYVRLYVIPNGMKSLFMTCDTFLC